MKIQQKLAFSTLLTIGLVGFSFAQTTILGKLKGIKDTSLFINYTDMNGFQSDIVKVRNGEFEWKKGIDHPTNVVFSLSTDNRSQHAPSASIWTEPHEVELSLDAKNLDVYQIKNSAVDEIATRFNASMQEDSDIIKKLTKDIQQPNVTDADKEKIIAQYRVVQKRITEKQLQFIEANPTSYFSAYLLYQAQQHIPSEQQEKYLNLLQKEAAGSPYANRIRYDIDGEKSGTVGGKAPVFETTDILGNSFNLQDLIGKKYIILDFWASWCVPCRQANPHLKELHNKYKEQGLEVICVADNDSSEPTWKKAVADDKIEQFTHVLRGWKGMEYFFNRQDISGKYGVKALPTKILIDLQGNIIGRYVGENPNSPEIDKKLKEIFGS